MRQPARSQRVVLTGALAVACAIACDTVLDIQDPTMRPSGSSGEAGEQTGGAPNSGGTNTVSKLPVGGEAGTPTVSGGNAGMGGVSGAANTSGSAGEAGQAGAGGAPECTPDAVRCAGTTEKSPEICDATSHWTANTTEAVGDCPVLCANGKCTVCSDGDKRCSVCADGDANCSTNQPQKCVDGAWADDGDECVNYCDKGGCVTPTSCNSPTDSRSKCTSNQSCCLSLLVPGGQFKRHFDGIYFLDDTHPAEISQFYLDKFEVTVGRMKQFVAAYSNLDLKNGDGKSNHIADDTGWSESLILPADTKALTDLLKCDGATWSDAEENTQLPINCVPFNLAYAFCIWDGGRLPTDAEWNFAAAAGNEQRLYPWKPLAGDVQITDQYAYFYADNHLLPTSVGSLSLGNARWGQADMAGNVSEWTLDYQQDPLPTDTCHDCLNTTASSDRTYHGGSFIDSEVYLVVSNPGYGDPTQGSSDLGFRCARDLK